MQKKERRMKLWKYFSEKVLGLKDDFVRRVQNTFGDEGPEPRLRYPMIRNASLLAINEAWPDFWSYPIVVFGSIFILFAALICGILIIISFFSLPSGQFVDITKAQQAKENDRWPAPGR